MKQSRSAACRARGWRRLASQPAAQAAQAAPRDPSRPRASRRLLRISRVPAVAAAGWPDRSGSARPITSPRPACHPAGARLPCASRARHPMPPARAPRTHASRIVAGDPRGTHGTEGAAVSGRADGASPGRTVRRAGRAREVSASSVVLLPHTPASVIAARGHSARPAQAGMVAPAIGDATLVVSDLLINAILHARPLPGARVLVAWALRDRSSRWRWRRRRHDPAAGHAALAPAMAAAGSPSWRTWPGAEGRAQRLRGDGLGRAAGARQCRAG